MSREERLMEWVERAQRRPFKWGTFDCGLMAADAVKAQTGNDPAESWRGKYKTAKGSIREMRKRKIKGFTDLGTEMLGEQIHPEMANRGDIALGIFGGRLETFMVDLGKTYLVMTEHGARQEDKDRITALTAWRAA